MDKGRTKETSVCHGEPPLVVSVGTLRVLGSLATVVQVLRLPARGPFIPHHLSLHPWFPPFLCQSVTPCDTDDGIRDVK